MKKKKKPFFFFLYLNKKKDSRKGIIGGAVTMLYNYFPGAGRNCVDF